MGQLLSHVSSHPGGLELVHKVQEEFTEQRQAQNQTSKQQRDYYYLPLLSPEMTT